jgi:hypothetical protein
MFAHQGFAVPRGMEIPHGASAVGSIREAVRSQRNRLWRSIANNPTGDQASSAEQWRPRLDSNQ